MSNGEMVGRRRAFSKRLDRASTFKVGMWLHSKKDDLTKARVHKAHIIDLIKKDLGIDIVPKQLTNLAKDAGLPIFWSDGGEREKQGIASYQGKVTACKIAIINMYNRMGEKLPKEFLEAFGLEN